MGSWFNEMNCFAPFFNNNSMSLAFLLALAISRGVFLLLLTEFGFAPFKSKYSAISVF